jgi:hypothetical protein
MRGLLINRAQGQAYGIEDFHWGVDVGNFLTHAILENRLSKLLWVHRIPGGREFDSGTVKYETDPLSPIRRITWKYLSTKYVPIQYDVSQPQAWRGLQKDDFLDIDWDYFACKAYSADSIDNQVTNFLNREFPRIPQQTAVCYSPNYSHPSKEQYRDFISKLAVKFNAEIIHHAPQESIQPNPEILKHFLPGIVYRTYFWHNKWFQRIRYGLKRRIYRILHIPKKK